MASIFQPPKAAAAPKIHHLPSTSSFIAAFEYDETNLTLSTWMRNGSLYQAKFFLPADWDNLKTSQNHSKHWANNVKGKHATTRVIFRQSPTALLKRRQSK